MLIHALAMSLGDAELARHVTCCTLRAGRRDHDEQREDVRRSVEEVIALRDADGLQGRANRASGAKKQCGQ